MSIELLTIHFDRWACLYYFGLLAFETPDTDRSLFYIERNGNRWSFGAFWLRLPQ